MVALILYILYLLKTIVRTCNELTTLKLIIDIYCKSTVDWVFTELKYLKIICLFPLHNCRTKLMALWKTYLVRYGTLHCITSFVPFPYRLHKFSIEEMQLITPMYVDGSRCFESREYWWFIEGLAFSRSYYLAPCPPPSTPHFRQ